MQLLYSLRMPDHALFRDELSQPAATVRTTWHYTRTVPPGWSRSAGRLTADDLKRETLPPDQASIIYICGPTGFVEAVSGALTGLGYAPDRIRTERFGGT
jgi:ferredoxin-NADP reductase